MTYSPIPKGTQNWDVPLNAALLQLDSNVTAGIAGALQASNNLSDLTSPAQARTNLGIGASAASGVSNFNVKDYGAVGNGVADDKTPIQNALAAATAAGGGTVFFPHGTYLVNSGTGFSTSASGVTLQGEGSNATQISIGASYTGTSLFTWTGNYGGVRDMSIIGSNTTTTSNPASHGVTVSGGQTFKVINSTFLNINGYAIRAIGTAATTLHGGQIDNVKIQSCAGGVFILSDSTNTAANFMISNLFTRFLGVNSGTNANLDGIHIEDSWDVMMQNVMPWMNATTGGTGAALRVKGNCAATFIQNLDALGPQTGAANVVIESGPNGDPQNVQIAGGVIQQGLTGISITGSSNQIRVRNMRILNNQTHNIVVSSNGSGSTGGIYFDECAISQGGAGATGTNYDINWTGTAEGFITDCRFGSPITTIGVAGVQGVVNITSAVVRADNVNFAGTGTLATNIFPGIFPQYLLRADLTNAEWRGNLDYRLTGSNRVSLRADTAGANALAFNVAGTAANDNFRILGDGSMEWGPGTAGRDTKLGRAASGNLYTDKNLLVGAATALGDNGVGEIQLANAATTPTTNPTGGVALYASATGAPLKIRDTAGKVRGLVKMTAVQTSTQTSVGTGQTASTALALAVEANATYLVNAWVYWTTAASATVTTSWTGPAGTTFVWNDTTTGGDVVTTLTGVSPPWATGNKMINLFGTLTTTGTAGTLTFTFASSVAASVTTQPQSTLTLERIA
jgi:hypothetical protein